jgi:hypothetical protein
MFLVYMIIVAVILLLLLVAAAGGYYMYTQHYFDTTPTPSPVSETETPEKPSETKKPDDTTTSHQIQIGNLVMDIPPLLTQPASSSTESTPSPTPSAAPTSAPTATPTFAPTSAPTSTPTSAPTSSPTSAPTAAPTQWYITSGRSGTWSGPLYSLSQKTYSIKFRAYTTKNTGIGVTLTYKENGQSQYKGLGQFSEGQQVSLTGTVPSSATEAALYIEMVPVGVDIIVEGYSGMWSGFGCSLTSYTGPIPPVYASSPTSSPTFAPTAAPTPAPIVVPSWSVMGTGTDGLPYVWDSLSSNKIGPLGSGSSILSLKQLKDSTILAVTSAKELWTGPTLEFPSWKKLGGCCVNDIEELQDGSFVGVGTNNFTYTTASLTNIAWTGPIANGGLLICMKQLLDGSFLGVGTDNKLYTKAKLLDTWNYIPDSCCFIYITQFPDGSFLGVGTDNNALYSPTLSKPANDWKKLSNVHGILTITPYNGKQVGAAPCASFRADPNWGAVSVPYAKYTDGVRNTAITILGNNKFTNGVGGLTNSQLSATLTMNCNKMQSGNPNWKTINVPYTQWTDAIRNLAIATIVENTGFGVGYLQGLKNVQLAPFLGIAV